MLAQKITYNIVINGIAKVLSIALALFGIGMLTRYLGTDGFGRSDTREKLRSFFEVDRYHITIAALKSLTDKGEFEATKIDEAIRKYNIDAEIIAPWLI